MKNIKLSETDLTVSSLCLGTAQFGTGRSREEAVEQMDLFAEAGGSFLDTAHVYGDWGCDKKGISEIVIGDWLREKKLRSSTVIVTKGCHPPLGNMLQPRVSREYIAMDVEESLENLGTDYIDLYLFHRDDPAVSVGELLESMEEHVKKGNLRYYGCSNWSLERVREAQKYAKEHVLKGFVCNQMMFTLADVDPGALEGPQLTIPGDEFYQYHKDTQLNFMAYMCMAGGLFTKMISGRELTAFQNGLYGSEGNRQITEKLKEYASLGYTVADFMLSYVWKAAFPSVPVVSFSSREQLSEALRSAERAEEKRLSASGMDFISDLRLINVPEEELEALISLKKQQVYKW